ncbi:LemA family protein [Glacieibacterium frigidum]|uniref:LemA family protein n=1 Tax=Glacieibacterium frigidum TaxID=2593303 RepID=A0A552UA36_9SPHN|nr:LemA family protein [Glacieibacterium frigidum]TRW15080.1 LemA family protein [Glacieibacterium frigidum]
MVRSFVRVALPLALLTTVAGCGVNTIPTKEENAKTAWANVESSYQRRADLIPNLVATVKGYAKFEQDTLVQVTNARAKATSITVDPTKLSDPAAVGQFEQAQGALSQSLGRLLVSVEKYPDLKANEQFTQLSAEIAGTENRINIARRDYNEAVRDYNTEIRTFPSVIGAKVIYGAKPLQPFKATSEGAKNAPVVTF